MSMQFPKIGSPRYQRVLDQLTKWIEGKPYHNEIDDQCLPDCSCCNIEGIVDSETRRLFFKYWLEENSTACVELQQAMFLGLADHINKAGGEASGFLPNKRVIWVPGADSDMDREGEALLQYKTQMKANRERAKQEQDNDPNFKEKSYNENDNEEN